MNLLFIIFLITSNVFVEIFGQLHVDNAIENLHIDTLVQSYMSLESHLWNYIYNSGAKTKDIIYKIRSDHGFFLSNSGLNDVMSYEYRTKFERFLNLTEFDNYDQEDSMFIALAEQPYGTVQSETFGISKDVIDNYNRIISKDLFNVIKEVSVTRW